MSELSKIIADASRLPLRDAAVALWQARFRLDRIEGRPTAEEIRQFRAMTPAQQAEKLESDRINADQGPMFGYLQRAHPGAGDAAIREAIREAVRFDSACFAAFVHDGTDYWQRVVSAVDRAARQHAPYLDSTYQAMRNHVAYYMK